MTDATLYICGVPAHGHRTASGELLFQIPSIWPTEENRYSGLPAGVVRCSAKAGQVELCLRYVLFRLRLRRRLGGWFTLTAPVSAFGLRPKKGDYR